MWRDEWAEYGSGMRELQLPLVTPLQKYRDAVLLYI